MNIHHATQKKADANDINIVWDVDKGLFLVEDLKTKRASYFAKAAFGLGVQLLSRTLATEYPILSVRVTENGSMANVYYDGDHIELGQFDVVPSIADLVELCEHFNVSAEDEPEFVEVEDEEDEKVAGPVVPDTYKRMYAERGNRNHCGDWLAKWLEGFSKGNSFDYVAFDDLLSANGVDKSGKWATLFMSGAKGWQGRYRMNGRQKLEQQIALTGRLVWLGSEVDVPISTLAAMEAKYKKEGGSA